MRGDETQQNSGNFRQKVLVLPLLLSYFHFFSVSIVGAKYIDRCARQIRERNDSFLRMFTVVFASEPNDHRFLQQKGIMVK